MQDDGRLAVLFNKYALEQEGLTPENDQRSPDREDAAETRPDRDGKARRSRRDDAELPVTHQPRSQRAPPPPATEAQGYLDSPPLPRSPRHSDRYSRHMPPQHDPRSRLSRLDEEYYYDDDYDDDYDDEEEDEMGGDKPVPIWLGVMLVFAYILAGAFLFAGWEGWGFLDSVYFCFITLTTIGFGDFVPAQDLKVDVELSIALCSIYLLFGIALLAMSFNLVQEEVISKVKNMARRLDSLTDAHRDPLDDCGISTTKTNSVI
ncbi:hypothetical protein C7M84_001523 [Penaeus vannamei]|uniref:Potassium channel domain-containing protein n=1 Tax=Penaeus vannamei TaxID=6689 RepID=A0A3R7SXA4_PENVA|nr:hypothetical protein C7M84_001523 [Penaeus vannamei]